MLKNFKIKLQKRGVKLKSSTDNRTVILQFLATFSNKTLLLEYILNICNNFAEQIALINVFLITQIDLTILLR